MLVHSLALLVLTTLGQTIEAPGAAADPHGDALPESAIARLGTARLRPGRDTFALTFSADGKLLATVHGDAHVELWDAATGKHHGRLTAPTGSALRSVACSADGKRLAAGDEAHVVWVWDLGAGKGPRQFKGHFATVTALAFAPNGKTLASAARDVNDGDGRDYAVRLWDVATGFVLHELAHDDHPTGVAFLKDGKRLATVGKDGMLRVWDVASGQGLGQHRLQGGNGWAVQALPDGKTVATLTWQKYVSRIELWDVDAGKALLAEPHRGDGGLALAAAPGERRLAVAANDGLHLIDAATGKTLRTFTPPVYQFWVTAFSPDGKRVAAATPARVYVWDVATGREVTPPEAHDGQIQLLRFLPGEKTILTAGRDQTVCVWDAATGKQLRRFAIPKINYYEDIDLSPDGRTLAVPRIANGQVALWDVASGKQTATLNVGDFPHPFLARFSPDGKVLAVAAHGPSGHRTPVPYGVQLLEVTTGKILHTVGYGLDHVRSVLFSPDGKLLVVGKVSPEIFDVATGKQVLQAPKSGQPLFFLPDGHTLALATGKEHWETGVALWDQRTGKTTPRLPEAPTHAFLGVTPGRGAVVLGPIRYEAVVPRLRDLTTGKLLARPMGHRGNVAALTFSADGKRLATAGWDNTVLVWDLAALRRRQEERRTALTAAEMEDLWAALGTQQSGTYLEVIDRLVEAPDATVAFLQKRLAPVSDAGLGRWVADLDAPAFARRNQASRELRRMEFAAAGELRKVLAGQPSLELRRRVEAILQELAEPVAPTHLRAWRAVTVLEQVNTPAARRLLEALAGGAAEARLTQAAQEAVRRVATPGKE
jgi:WD40 repeat protein